MSFRDFSRRTTTFACMAIACCLATQAYSLNLTDLDPVNALFQGDEDSLSTLAGGPGNNGLDLKAATDIAAGFTYNIDVTPDTADLDGLVLLMEIGGTTNGVGLYLIDGVPTLALKTGASGTPPSSDSVSDLDFSDGAASIFSSYGPITAGNSISIAATWGTNNLYSLAVQDNTAQYSTLDALTITGKSDTSYNWEGNGTFNVGDDLEPNPGSRGGLTDSTTSMWGSGNMVNLTADLATDSAIYWNDRATLTVDFGAPPPPPVPTLIVDRDTGNITLENMSSSAVTLIGYTIQTTNGGFDTSAWNQVDDLDTNDSWEQLTAAGNPTTDLSEATLGSGYTMGASGTSTDSIDLGNVWIKSPFENLTFEFRDDAGEVVDVKLSFTGHNDEAYLLGDFDFMDSGNDGSDIDEADWAILRANLVSDPAAEGLLAYSLGDMNLDGLVNELDFDAFKLAYDAANGAGAFSAMLAGSSVPEPSSVVLFALAGLATLAVRGRRQLAAVLALAVMAMFTTSASAQTTLFSDSFDRATTQENDIDATSTGMSGTLAPLVYNENGDDTLVLINVPDYETPEIMTNLENDTLHLADGPNASAFYLEHNFIDSAITSDGILSVKFDLLSNDGTFTDTQRFVGFGVGATLAEFQAQAQLDEGGTPDSKALRGTVNVADSGFGDLWVGWSPNGTGVIQVIKNGNLMQSIDDGITNAVDGEGDLQPYAEGSTTGATLELRMAVADFDAGSVVPATIYFNGVAIGGDTFRWDNTDGNYIGVAARQNNEGFTVDNLAISTDTASLDMQTLSLEVNPETGEVFLVGGASDVAIDRYSISSAGGLESGSFDGIGGDSGLPLGDGSGNGWELGGVQSDSYLTEFFLGAGTGASTLDTSFRASLGTIYDTTADTRDLMVTYHLTDGTLISGGAIYTTTPAGTPGDFNDDGLVDIADYVVWRNHLGSSFDLNGNGNETGGSAGVVDAADYSLWKSNFGTGSTGSLAEVQAAVPEPSSLCLLALGLLAFRFRK